ncbi:MAG: MOSC domain-containing protein [Nitrospira sp.]|nr:MAG: MOSC domain-containing protein [Nitrospira sp.]
MTTLHADAAGSIASIWRYPVKSMLGEELNAADITRHGLAGDRAFAVIDRETGKVASAKHPKKWGRLFECLARFGSDPQTSPDQQPVHITLPDGRLLTAGEPDLPALLSVLLGRPVDVTRSVPEQAKLEEYWPEVDGRAHQNATTDEALPPGTFFDAAIVHLITTATLDALRAAYPTGQFETRRFRPNLVVRTAPGTAGFAENEWIGRTIAIGDQVQLRITGPCARCVMTTLPQRELPEDTGILRTAVKHNRAAVGVYATVLNPGVVRLGHQLHLTT